MQSFWSHWAWPLATSVLGFLFTGLVLRQWLKRRKPHQVAWMVGLLFYSVAGLMEFWSEYSGEWNPTVYRIYIVLAASLVSFLGLGTLYLLVRRHLWGHVYLGFTLVCLVVFLAGTFTTTLVAEKLVPGITVGGQALGPSLSFPRLMSFFFNIPGAVLLIGGALFSIWRFSHKREYSYRMWANVLIALGAIVIAFVGSRARLGNTAGLYPAEMFASALMLAGFLLAGTLQKGAKAGRKHRHPEMGTRPGESDGGRPTRRKQARGVACEALPDQRPFGVIWLSNR